MRNDDRAHLKSKGIKFTMTIQLIYYTTLSYFSWIITITLMSVIINLFIIISGRRQPDHFKSRYLLIITGLINIAIIIVSAFIPRMLIYGSNIPEFRIFLIYNFTIEFIVLSTTLSTYGAMIILFAKKNTGNFENYLIIAGIFMVIAQTLGIISCALKYFYVFENLFLTVGYDMRSDPIWIFYISSIDLDRTAYACSLVFFIAHGIKTKDKYISLAFLLILIRDSITGVLYLFFSRLIPF